MRLPSFFAFAALVSSGCALGPVEQRCNSDIECASRSCILGACRDRIDAPPTDEAIVDEPPTDIDDDDDDVADVECTPETGFVVFDDRDLDGFGAGASRCALTIEAGSSTFGDDCNDDDATVHALTTVYDDADDDGFTAGARLACVSESAPPPAGLRFERGDAPVHLVAPTVLDARDGNWEGALFDPINGESTGVLALSGFACAAVPDRVSGVQARLLVQDLVHDDVRRLGVGLQVVTPDGVASQPSVATIDVEGYASFTHGGPGDTLGLAALTPEAVCDPDLVVLVTLEGSATLTSLFFVAVELAVFGVDDCDDTLDEAFSPARLLSDEDGDGAGDGLPADECVGGELPAGRAVRDGDCAPSDPRAFPGQTKMFTSSRQGVGGFDFNCDGDVERQDESVQRIVENSCSFDGSFCNWSQNQVNPSCGASVTVFGHCTTGCNLATFTQSCR